MITKQIYFSDQSIVNNQYDNRSVPLIIYSPSSVSDHIYNARVPATPDYQYVTLALIERRAHAVVIDMCL